jgi:SAM-dependent methyltransferase
MTTKEAIQLAIEKFPFKDYMTSGSEARRVYFNVANAVMRHLQPGSRILDFGSGPCDKTAILQLLGFQCSAYDDLQDDWHQIPGNQDKIISFAKECGIHFKLAMDNTLPFEKNYFDMVMLHAVIEHLHDSPRELLNDLLELVKPGGFLFITVPNAVNIRKRIAVLFGKTNLTRFEEYYWPPGPWRGHIREYVKDDLVKLSEYLSLDVLEIRGCDHMLEYRLSPISRTVYLFFTGMFKGWKDSWLLVARKRQGWVPRRTVPHEKLAELNPRLSLKTQ